jgi:hypothetical protein
VIRDAWGQQASTVNVPAAAKITGAGMMRHWMRKIILFFSCAVIMAACYNLIIPWRLPLTRKEKSMSTLEKMQALQDAYGILNGLTSQASSGTMPVWRKLDHARNYLDQTMRGLLAE